MNVRSIKRNLEHTKILTISFRLVTSWFGKLYHVTAVGFVVVPMTTSICVGECIFSKIAGEYLQRKEQHNLMKYTLAGGTLNDFHKLQSKCLEDDKTGLMGYNKLKQIYNM